MVDQSNPPPPPPFPVGTTECGFCRYKDKSDTYEHTCWSGIAAAIALMMIGLTPLLMIILKLLGEV